VAEPLNEQRIAYLLSTPTVAACRQNNTSEQTLLRMRGELAAASIKYGSGRLDVHLSHAREIAFLSVW
jgi:hypothetical protein